MTKPAEKRPDIFVVGTDTGVGKTVVALLLMQRLFAGGYCPAYLKPFQTGCRSARDRESDARFVYRHTPALKDRDPAEAVIFCHPAAKAPFFAARDLGQAIDTALVQRTVAWKRKTHHPLVIEVAGGLLVPITRREMVIDLIRPLNCRPLLVARAGLGTINHTLLSIEALRRRRMAPLGVLLVAQSGQAAGADGVRENRKAIEILGGVPAVGLVGPIADFGSPPQKACSVVDKFLFGD